MNGADSDRIIRYCVQGAVLISSTVIPAVIVLGLFYGLL